MSTTPLPPLPDFTNQTLFPTFLTIPQDDVDQVLSSSSSSSSSSNDQAPPTWYLLAQIKDNMTINKPTLVLTDRAANPFALVFDDLGRDDLDLKGLGLKKGSTAIIPCARRTKPADESKRGFVRIQGGGQGGQGGGVAGAEMVRAVPAPLARVLEVGGKSGKGSACENCGRRQGEGLEEDGGGLKSCTGCERVGYCSKECQVKGWTEGGHKNDCKMFKALNSAFASS